MYKIVGQNNLNDILGTMLENRGIKDKESFLNPSKYSVISPYLLKNMKKAVELFKTFLKTKGSRAIVLVDSDP